MSLRDDLNRLNEAIVTRGAEGDPVTVRFGGRPNIHVDSVDPLTYQRYGRGVLRAAAPTLQGEFVVCGLLERQWAHEQVAFGAYVLLGDTFRGTDLWGINASALFLNGIGRAAHRDPSYVAFRAV